MSSKSVEKSPGKETSALTNAYLAVYNLASSLGWTYVLFSTLVSNITTSGDEFVDETWSDLYFRIRTPLLVMLSTASLEVVHAALGLVKSNPVIVFIQVFVRFIVIKWVADVFPLARDNIGVFMVCFAWSVSEVVRYLYYFHNLINNEIYMIKWLRYNMFIVLYPIGAFSEMIILAHAAFYLEPDYIREEYSLQLPNNLNFSYDLYYVFWFLIALYVPAFPVMYKHMLAQRRKYMLNESKIDASKKKQ